MAINTSFETKGCEVVFDELLLLDLEKRSVASEKRERAKRAQDLTGGSLVDIFIRLGLCEEKTLAAAVAEISGLAIVSPESFPETPIRKDELSIPFLRESRVLPLSETDSEVSIATVDPSDQTVIRAIEMAFQKKARVTIGLPSQIEDALLKLYLAEELAGDDDARTGDVTNTDIARLRESAGEAPIVKFVERLIARAIDLAASDIHIEPLERQLRVRLRVDGMLADDEAAPLSWGPAIISRVKILARLDIAERRLPQDGSIKMNVRGREIDLRVATAPSVNGEAVVIRILDRNTVRLDLCDLGFAEGPLGKIGALLDRPNGIFLVTGPTGSGKSTTLYAALERLNRPLRKIITVEDPVEYKIEGLNQIQVKPEIGLDFAKTLRSILRQDPDVIMIGEIRDSETAKIASQAALTGHLVLSTLHTNDAASSATRLLDMGIESYLVTSTLIGVLAQRLVRVLCPNCKRRADIPAGLDFASDPVLRDIEPKIYEAVGCPSCRGTGYQGRSVISELLVLDDPIRQCILDNQGADKLRNLAVERGMETLYQNGIRAMCAGITTFDEILRVAEDVSR